MSFALSQSYEVSEHGRLKCKVFLADVVLQSHDECLSIVGC